MPVESAVKGFSLRGSEAAAHVLGGREWVVHPDSTHVLVVDDELGIRRYLSRTLEASGYVVTACAGAHEALEAFLPGVTAVVLADLRMPDRDGLWLLDRLRERDRDVAIVMVTGSSDVHAAVECLTRGAVNYVLKPVHASEILEVITRARDNRRLALENRMYREHLEVLVEERTARLHGALRSLEQTNAALDRSYRESIYRLATAAEYRDEETGNHILRIGLFAEAIALHHGCEREFSALLRLAGPMHDVGKIGIRDSVLLKPGTLDAEEFEEIKQHPAIGARILAGSESPLMQLAESIALTHHEWFDGSGYPRGLSREEIPLEGRIVALADVFDALTTKRVYKPAYSEDFALGVMREERGTHFDPEIFDAFLRAQDDILAIKRRYDDGSGAMESGALAILASDTSAI